MARECGSVLEGNEPKCTPFKNLETGGTTTKHNQPTNQPTNEKNKRRFCPSNDVPRRPMKVTNEDVCWFVEGEVTRGYEDEEEQCMYYWC